MGAILFWSQTAEVWMLVWNFSISLSGNIDNNDIVSLSKSMLLGYHVGAILKNEQEFGQNQDISLQ